LRDRKGKSARIAEKIKKKIGVDVSVKPEEPKAISVKPVEQVSKIDEVKKEEKKVEAKAEKQTSEKK
jgi:large subunit ribosomal protein L19